MFGRTSPYTARGIFGIMPPPKLHPGTRLYTTSHPHCGHWITNQHPWATRIVRTAEDISGCTERKFDLGVGYPTQQCTRGDTL